MNAIYLLLLASAGCAVAVKKISFPKADMIFVSSDVEYQQTYTTIKIPYGQSAEISCSQKRTDSESTRPEPRRRSKQRVSPKPPVQTVKIQGAKYLIPDGAKNCLSESALGTKQVSACNGYNSTSCIFLSDDAATTNGCKKRRLGIRYFCGDADAPASPVPAGFVMSHMMVNNMIDDN